MGKLCFHTKTASTCRPGKIDWSVYFSSMAETTPNTPSTRHTQDWRKNTVFPPPETKTYQLEDGSIRVEVGEFWKVVSSWHLTEVAENQLIQAYREHYSK